MRPTVVIGFLGSTLDASKFGPTRWNKWRPTVGLCMHDDLRVDRLRADPRHAARAARRLRRRRHRRGLAGDRGRAAAGSTSPTPGISRRSTASCSTSPAAYPFDPEAEDYLVHITTGTHVAQICLFLLTEARYLPGRLLQTQPAARAGQRGRAAGASIDLDLSRYDSIATRFAAASGGGHLVPQIGHRDPQRRLQPDDRRDRAGRRSARARRCC